MKEMWSKLIKKAIHLGLWVIALFITLGGLFTHASFSNEPVYWVGGIILAVVNCMALYERWKRD